MLAYKSLRYFFISLSLILFLGLATYDEFDPSPFSVGDEPANNFLGVFGARFSSILFYFGDPLANPYRLLLLVELLSYQIIKVLHILRIIIIFFATLFSCYRLNWSL